jgi:hypothetical protein
MPTETTSTARASGKRRRLIESICGTATAINARAARHDAAGVHFHADPHGHRPTVEARVVELVERCERFATNEWGVDLTLHIRLDYRKARSRSRGGVYAGRWATERVDPRLETARGPGINIAVGRRVWLSEADPFRAALFQEYAHLRPWADVGCIDTHAPLDVVVVHEAAHAFQYGGTRAICDRLGLPVTASKPAHGRLFAEIYARLRVHFGMVVAGRPRWLELPPVARDRAVAFRRMPPVDGIVQAAVDPDGYRREVRARQQRERRQRRQPQAAASG